MYDVLHSRRQGSDILYYCYKDDEETTLINRLNETIAKDRERSGAVGGAYKVILNLFATALPLLHDYQYPTSYLKTIFCFADYPDYFSKGFGRLNSPPPDFTA